MDTFITSISNTNPEIKPSVEEITTLPEDDDQSSKDANEVQINNNTKIIISEWNKLCRNMTSLVNVTNSLSVLEILWVRRWKSSRNLSDH